jgi:hypothetical protein
MANQKTSNSLLVRETKQLMNDNHYLIIDHFQDGTINVVVTTLEEDETVQEISLDHYYASHIYNFLGRYWEDMVHEE